MKRRWKHTRIDIYLFHRFSAAAEEDEIEGGYSISDPERIYYIQLLWFNIIFKVNKFNNKKRNLLYCNFLSIVELSSK